MGLIAKNESRVEIKKIEDGVYTAVSTMLIDLGIQQNDTFKKKQRKIMIVWEILGETIEIDGKELPRIISKEYTLSLGEKSTLRKDLQAWRGRAFSTDELEGFDLINILNVPCQIQIINVENNEKTYPNIAAIMAMPKGMTVEGTEETIYFNTYDPETWSAFSKIPKWIQDKIRKCENVSDNQLDLFIKQYDELIETEKEQKTETNKTLIEETPEIPQDGLPF